MASVELREARTSGDLRRFVKFPFRLYKDCDQWVPPLISDEIKSLRTDSNPAFEYCRARYWLAYQDGRIVGRIAGIVNNRAIEKWESRLMRFGWFDFVDDRAVSSALVGAVEDWAREEKLTGVHGPMGFTDLDSEGLLVEGYDEMGTMLDIYNYPYYADHLEALGYAKDTDWVEYELETPKEIPAKVVRVGELILKRGGLHLVEAKRSKDLLPYARQAFALINQAFEHLYGTVELSQKQIDAYVDRYFSFIDPRFNKAIVDGDDKLVGVGFVFPSLTRALQKSRGRLFPFGFVRLLRAIRHPSRLDLGIVAVSPEYQGRGIPALLMTEITKAAIEQGVRTAETGRELEDNVQVRSLWKSYNGRQHKRRRVYLKQLG
jgi:GNAT superfamily N-acetyltransferase